MGNGITNSTGGTLGDVLSFFQARRDALVGRSGDGGTGMNVTYWRDAQIAASAIAGQVIRDLCTGKGQGRVYWGEDRERMGSRTEENRYVVDYMVIICSDK